MCKNTRITYLSFTLACLIPFHQDSPVWFTQIVINMHFLLSNKCTVGILEISNVKNKFHIYHKHFNQDVTIKRETKHSLLACRVVNTTTLYYHRSSKEWQRNRKKFIPIFYRIPYSLLRLNYALIYLGFETNNGLWKLRTKYVMLDWMGEYSCHLKASDKVELLTKLWTWRVRLYNLTYAKAMR